MRSFAIQVVTVATIASISAACSGASGDPVASPTPSQVAADTTFVADVDIDGGRTLHVACLGPIDTGRPTVIFENGLGGDYGQWGEVLKLLKTTDRGCAYDRAGVNLSPPASGPRTTADQVEDLRALLAAAEIDGPYVLVGHSSGSWNTLLHADTHRDDVAGVVLVDPRPPLASERFLAALPPEAADEAEVVREYRAGFTEWEHDPTGNPESLHLADSSAQVAAVTDLGALPLIVLAADGAAGLEGDDLEPELAGTFEDIWWELQADLAGLSTEGRLEKVADTGHDMPNDRSDAILEAIGELLGG